MLLGLFVAVLANEPFGPTPTNETKTANLTTEHGFRIHGFTLETRNFGGATGTVPVEFPYTKCGGSSTQSPTTDQTIEECKDSCAALNTKTTGNCFHFVFDHDTSATTRCYLESAFGNECNPISEDYDNNKFVLYSLTAPFTDVSYHMVLGGTCEEAGHETITFDEECTYAANHGLGGLGKLKWNFGFTGGPAGCIYNADYSSFRFNEEGSATVQDVSPGGPSTIYHVCASTGPPVVCDTEDNDITVAVLAGAFAAAMVALLAMIYAHCVGYKAIGSLGSFGKFSAKADMSQTML